MLPSLPMRNNFKLSKITHLSSLSAKKSIHGSAPAVHFRLEAAWSCEHYINTMRSLQYVGGVHTLHLDTWQCVKTLYPW